MVYNLYVDMCSDRFPGSGGSHVKPTRVALIAEEDGNVVGTYIALIKPEGWGIEDEVQKYLHASYDECVKGGVPITTAAHEARTWCHPRMRIVAHNMAFHRATLQALLDPIDTDLSEYHPDFFCTMKAVATDLGTRQVALPTAYCLVNNVREPPAAKGWRDHAETQLMMVRQVYKGYNR